MDRHRANDKKETGESWTTPERNAYLRRMGVTIMCAKGRPPVCDFARIAGRDWKALRASAR